MLLQDANTLRLFSILGISIRINPVMVLVIGLLLVYEVAVADPQDHVDFLVSGLLMVLGSVFVHELGHAVVARCLKIPVLDITLNLFYAVTRTGPPPTPGSEICVAAGGPSASLLLCGILQTIRAIVQPEETPADQVLHDAVLINLLLGVANLVPAFPMDGGRIFRALLELRMGHLSATRAAVWVGRALAAPMLASPLWFGMSPLSFGLPLVALVILALGEQELRRAKS